MSLDDVKRLFKFSLRSSHPSSISHLPSPISHLPSSIYSVPSLLPHTQPPQLLSDYAPQVTAVMAQLAAAIGRDVLAAHKFRNIYSPAVAVLCSAVLALTWLSARQLPAYCVCCRLLCSQADGSEGEAANWAGWTNVPVTPDIAPVPPSPLSGALLPLEDYLYAVMLITADFPRLAMAAVTQGNFTLPLEVAGFVSDLHTSLQLLNLKNDRLRKRFDAIKYDLKRCEEIVYDLKIRGLASSAPRASASAPSSSTSESSAQS